MPTTEVLMSWLNDAHAAEQAQISMLQQVSQLFQKYPEVLSGLEEHLETTRPQADRVRECIETLGGTVTTGTSLLETMASPARDVLTHLSESEMTIKTVVMLHAAEHFEHASYMALAERARACGEDKVAEVCEQIAEEEKQAANWMEAQLPSVVRAAFNG